MASAFWPKKFFPRDCLIQWAEKVFFMRLYDTMGPKSFFLAIVRYNGPKKFFSCDCTIQWAEKVFSARLYDTMAPHSSFRQPIGDLFGAVTSREQCRHVLSPVVTLVLDADEG